MSGLIFRVCISFISILFAVWWVGTACSNETDPTVLPPTLTLHEATGITRNEACLSGKIVLNGEGTVRDCYFVYGSSPEEMIQVAGGRRRVRRLLEGLKAGTGMVSAWKFLMEVVWYGRECCVFVHPRTRSPCWERWF